MVSSHSSLRLETLTYFGHSLRIEHEGKDDANTEAYTGVSGIPNLKDFSKSTYLHGIQPDNKSAYSPYQPAHREMWNCPEPFEHMRPSPILHGLIRL